MSRERRDGQSRGTSNKRFPGGDVEWTDYSGGNACPAERTGSSRQPRRNPGKFVYELHARLSHVQTAELELDRTSARRVAERDRGHRHVQRIDIDGGRRGENERTSGSGGGGVGIASARR